MFIAPQHFRLGDQATKVTVRAVVACSAGDRQHPLGRHSALRFADPLGDQIGHLVVVVLALDPNSRRAAGLELIHDPFHGLMGRAAQISGSSIRPELLVGSNDVHTVLRRLQWNSPVVAMSGWHLHRHRRGPQFLINTTNTGWGLLIGHQWGPPLGHQWGLFHGHGQRMPTPPQSRPVRAGPEITWAGLHPAFRLDLLERSPHLGQIPTHSGAVETCTSRCLPRDAAPTLKNTQLTGARAPDHHRHDKMSDNTRRPSSAKSP